MRPILCFPRKVSEIYSFSKERENAYKSFAVLTFSVLPLKINKTKKPSLGDGLV